MASFAVACRLSARLARRRLSHNVTARGFRTSTAALAAQNFTMPALSPTMTEGNIAAWRVKEGDKFSAGDVLLEIETDKATMDVEAQEEGVVMKITQGDGSKSVQVGTRIAVLAEEGDDIGSLELPVEENATQSSSTSSEQPAPAPEPTPEQPASTPPRRDAKPQTYPLLPSVGHLVRENGLDESAVAKMTPTGPNGRLLKGDVLAYLGKISPESPAGVSERFEKASHLDLSNIKAAAAKPQKVEKAEKTEKVAAAPVEEDAVVSLPVTLEAVVGVQKRVHDTLGTFLPLSTFIARAAEVANDELPLPAGTRPTADELFNQVLGLDKVDGGARASRGAYLPQVSALPPASLAAPRPAAPRRPDIIDILAGASSPPVSRPKRALSPGLSGGTNVFSLSVPRREEKRARVFLDRVKLILEKDPGRLVL